jgi:hypothetical protein
VEVTSSGGTEIGSLQVMPVGSDPTVSQPLLVTSGTVAFTGVGDQYSLSGQFGPSCSVISVGYDNGTQHRDSLIISNVLRYRLLRGLSSCYPRYA